MRPFVCVRPRSAHPAPLRPACLPSSCPYPPRLPARPSTRPTGTPPIRLMSGSVRHGCVDTWDRADERDGNVFPEMCKRRLMLAFHAHDVMRSKRTHRTFPSQSVCGMDTLDKAKPLGLGSVRHGCGDTLDRAKPLGLGSVPGEKNVQ